MIKFKNVTKKFGDIAALSNVTFEIENGEFVFITGPSGAGKTTLIKLILREILPDSGEVIFDGINLTQLPEKEIPEIRRKMGTVFQDFKVLPERTLRENVEVALAVCNIPIEEWKGRVDKILELVGLGERSELFPSQLSGGELQRASLARALVVNPKLLMADEPTGNLDWDTSDGIMQLFERINKEGKTIIMATHNEMILNKYKKRIIRLKLGKIVNKEESRQVEKPSQKVENKEEPKSLKAKEGEV